VRRPLSLPLNTAWSLGGNVVFAASQWGIIVLLARTAAPDVLGVYTFTLAVLAPAMLVAQMNMRLIQAVDADREFRFADAVAVRLAGLVVVLPVVTAIVASKFGWTDPLGLVVLLGLARATDALADLAHGVMQQHQRLDGFGMSMAVRGCLQLIGFAGGVGAVGSLTGGGAGFLAGSIITLLTYDLPRVRELLGDDYPRVSALVLSWKRGRGVMLLRRTAPLGAMAVIGSLNQNMPRYVLEQRLDLIAVGHYSAVFYFTFIGSTVVLAMGNAAAPRLAALYRANQRRFVLLTVLLGGSAACLGLSGIMIALLAGAWILRTVYTPDYAQLQPLLVWSMVAGTLWYVSTALSFAGVAAQRLHSQAWLNVAALVIIALSCGPLIDARGLSGAAIALTCGMAVLCAGQIGVVRAAARAAPPVRPATALSELAT
jgi:O-antigen/teichoic acid export membrane protein